MCLHDSGSNYILAFPTQPSATSRRLAMSQSHGVNTSGVSQPIETRRADDGVWYTHAQFKDHYGDLAYWHWVSAEQQTAPDGCGPPLPPVPPPPSTTPPAGSGASDGAHLAGDDEPLQALPPCPVLTLEELRNRAPVQGMAERAAYLKQRELRAVCLSTGSFHIDLTNDAWSWRDVLRSMPAAVQAVLVGPGVTKFDHHYARIDSGERDVFEITRGDGSTCHLHFHKNGKMDPPEYEIRWIHKSSKWNDTDRRP